MIRNHTRTHTRLFEEVIIKSWWVILFFLICLYAYDKSTEKRKKEEGRLREKLNLMLARKQSVLEHKEILMSQIGSQDDREWIELVLKRRLGMVPEGETKVIFKNDVP